MYVHARSSELRDLHQIKKMDLVNCGQEASELFRVQSHMYKHLFSFVDSMSLGCAIQLGIPDIIHSHGQPMTLPQLVSKLHIDPKKTICVYRLMRLLSHSGFFTKTTTVQENREEEEEAYALTPSSRLVLNDDRTSLSPFVVAMLDPALVNPWYSLGDWFRGTELTPFAKVNGMGLWDYCNQNPEYGDTFNEAMASDSRFMSLVVKEYKSIFEGLGSLVDVGGGTGTMLILHDWNDEDCVNILKRCKEAITSKCYKKGNKVIIIDAVINEEKDDEDTTKAKLLFDTLMMVLLPEKERTKKEWEKLFMEAGFSRYKIVASYGMKSLIEVYH